MARRKASANLGTRETRLQLPAKQKHSEPVGRGRYIIYRRPQNGACGSWSARWINFDVTPNVEVRERMGEADDFLEANGIDILTWTQVTDKAGKWFQDQDAKAKTPTSETSEAAGSTTVKTSRPGPASYSVRDAGVDYQEYLRREGKDVVNAESTFRVHINPAMGDLEVTELTMAWISEWRTALAEIPRRKTGKHTSESGAWGKEPPTEDQLRARKSTANRIISVFKAALNLAVSTGRIPSEFTPWEPVKPFKKVGGVRTRFLTPDEQRRLVAGCSDEFRPLVIAALFTGSRLGPLTRMLVRDFNPQAATVYVQQDKNDRDRYVVLSDEAVAWFEDHVEGREAGEYMFLRAEGVKRGSRVDIGRQWAPDDQTWAMEKALEASGVEDLTFHELRHTYASGLVNRGVPLAYVAEQLGHADTRMVEKHYGHLCASAMSQTIRAKMPVLNLQMAEVEPRGAENVVAFHARKEA